MLGRMADDITLQAFLCRVFAIGLQTFALDAGLTFRTTLPTRLRAFVAAHVDIFRGEQGGHFREHIVNEAEHGVVACAEHIVRNAPNLPHLVWPTRTAEVRIGRQSSLHVSWQVDFGNDGDVALAGVVHHLADVALRIEALVRAAVIFARVVTNDRFGAVAAHLRQTRVFLDFDAPSLVVGDVPVHSVDVVEGKHIDEPQYAVLRHEVARHIQMGSAVTEAWVVRNLHGGHADARSLSCGCNGLAQGLDAVEGTCSTGSLNADAVSRHAEAVCLGILVLEVSREKDSRHTSFGFGGLFELQTSGLC